VNKAVNIQILSVKVQNSWRKIKTPASNRGFVASFTAHKFF